MPDRTPRTRRQILGAVTGVGALSFLGGAGTYALLTDEERLGASVTGGRLDVQVAAGTGTEPQFAFGDAPATVSLGDLAAGDSGRAAIGLRACEVPTTTWIRMRPTAESSTPLLEALDVTLTVERPDEAVERYAGSASGLLERFGEGLPLAECVACAPTVLALDWALPSAIDDDLRGASASIAVDAFGRRCIEDPTTGVNPWNETH